MTLDIPPAWRPVGRGGFTALELLMVLIIMAVLTAIGMPFLIRSLHQGRVNEAANLVAFTVEEARQASLQQRGLYEQIEDGIAVPVPYGVIIRRRNAAATPGEGAHVQLMGYQDGSTTPEPITQKRFFNSNVDLVFPGGQDEQELWFEFETGFLGQSWDSGTGVDVMAPASGDPITDQAVRIHVATNDYDGAWDGDSYKFEFTKGLHSSVTFFPYVGISHVD